MGKYTEMSLLDYGGKTNKNVDWRVNDNNSGIVLNGFRLNAEDISKATIGKDIGAGDVEFTVEEVIQYVPWNYGKVTPGSGQLGIYKVKDDRGNEKYALIKDYRAFEGDWRIMLLFMTDTEHEMKEELMMDRIGMTFMEYLFPMK